jgi:GH15 family glucan-1,4-alpha-glucosidase
VVAVSDRAYPPIESYGLVGNLETCALVAPDGSVDWFPFPHLESPSVFAAVLDAERGGRFRIAPRAPFESTQRYVDRTNVLETTFRTASGTATVTDFLPPDGAVEHPSKVLYRRVACSAGSVDFELLFEPRLDYARAESTLARVAEGVSAAGGGERTVLEGPAEFDVRDDRATADVALSAGQSEWYLLRCSGAEDAAVDPDAALEDTLRYWTEWAHDCDDPAGCAFAGPWHDLVVRSGLVLKLLTHAETGAVAAAPTTSLPEDVGGVRNWDYRFTWLRDAGFTVQALSNLGHADAANDYVEWFMGLCGADEPAAIQPVYGLHGDADLKERELDHLAGYRDSRPVRIGNGAADQTQLDVYGEILLAVDEALAAGRDFEDGEWETVRGIVEYVREVWDRPDSGIWEVRNGPHQFVHSKVMCWAALDRGIDIATRRGLRAPVESWRETRETIRADVLENGYDDSLGTFVQSYGSETVDATALLFPVVGFLPFDDERVSNTIATVEDRLVEAEVLVRRYDGDDGLPGEEGAFTLCSCWLVDALTLSGRVEEARERFASLVEYVSPVGLLAEELDPGTGAHLGNFPQAFSHVGIVNSALYVGYAEGHELPGPPPMGVRLGEPVQRD